MPDRKRLPGGIWALGFVSFFMDASSEMVHSLLPLFLVSGLGASALVLGLIEGVSEAIASITKVFSGALSDFFKRRKPLVVLGYGLAALSKPFFPLATSISAVAAARFADRIGKGIRGAPRDAMIGDMVDADVRGAAYGLRQSLDTFGAVAGPLAAIGLMWVFLNDIRTVYWFAILPAVLSVTVLILFVKEPKKESAPGSVRKTIQWADVGLLEKPFWLVVAVASFAMLARFSEAFLILRMENLGLELTFAPAVLIIMSVVYALSAYPAGRLSDHYGRRIMLALGFVALIVADFFLALTNGRAAGFAGIALWGLHMGLTQGLFAALVADTAPGSLRGTAFGVFHLATGLMLLVASGLAGLLWDLAGPATVFFAGAGFSAITLLAVKFLPGKRLPSLTE